ncbi:MAG: sulfurtransferase [Gammaproteobacteria bacterium]|nr:sulfurtransferase [Gammaproteobacteria bacterium]
MYTTIVEAEVLASHLDNPEWVIIDCRYDLGNVEAGRQAYNVDHIPNAHYAHLDEDLSSPIGPTTGRHPLPDPELLATRFSAWGITNDVQVIVYDGGPGAFAARLWWLLKWTGHDKVALLNGGYAAWQTSGYPCNAETPQTSSTTFTLKLNPDLLVYADLVDQVRLDENFCIVDARAPERFRGDIEPLDKVAGHITGAKNSSWENNINNTRRFKSESELRQLFSQTIGDVRPDHVIHSCGSGVTACHNVLAMEIAGLAGSKLYAGSWSEWITVPGRAISKGND